MLFFDGSWMGLEAAGWKHPAQASAVEQSTIEIAVFILSTHLRHACPYLAGGLLPPGGRLWYRKTVAKSQRLNRPCQAIPSGVPSNTKRRPPTPSAASSLPS